MLGDAFTAVDDFVDELQGSADDAGEFALGLAAGFEFVAEIFAGRECLGGVKIFLHGLTSMIIFNRNNHDHVSLGGSSAVADFTRFWVRHINQSRNRC